MFILLLLDLLTLDFINSLSYAKQRFFSLMTSIKVSAFKCLSRQPTCPLVLLNRPQCGREIWEQEIAENTNLPVQEVWMLYV